MTAGFSFMLMACEHVFSGGGAGYHAYVSREPHYYYCISLSFYVLLFQALAVHHSEVISRKE